MEYPKQIKCYCGHTTYCDCSPLEEPNPFELPKALPDDVFYESLEPKQETTLEEAAEKYAEIYRCPATNHNEYCRHDIISAINFGAKWQQERMYSKENMIEFAEFVASYPDKNRNVNDEMLHAKSKYDGAERTIDLLEQYHNETFKK